MLIHVTGQQVYEGLKGMIKATMSQMLSVSNG
jgi:hypothetical protein